jgi:hypothetical protein
MRMFRAFYEHLFCIIIYLPFIFIFSFIFLGCYKMDVESRTPDFPVKKCLEYDLNKTSDNICMALLPIQEEHEIDKYFGHSLYSASILPVLVVIENANEDSSFLLPADEPKIYLFKLDENIKKNQPQNLSEATGNLDVKKSIFEYGDIKWKEGKDSRIARGFITGLGMGVTGIILENLYVGPTEGIRTSAYNVTRKTLRKETLSPLETENGFIYVKLPNEVYKNHKLFVNISVKNMKTGQKIKFDFIEDFKK